MNDSTAVKTRIEKKLTQLFSPIELRVVDESHRHAGHADAGSETHFFVHIVTKAFRAKTSLERHQMIYAALEDEMKAGVHALRIRAIAPD